MSRHSARICDSWGEQEPAAGPILTAQGLRSIILVTPRNELFDDRNHLGFC